MKLFDKLIRRLFCKTQVRKGHITVVWKDVDGNYNGWDVSADRSGNLAAVASCIDNEKNRRLSKILGTKAVVIEKGYRDRSPFIPDDD